MKILTLLLLTGVFLMLVNYGGNMYSGGDLTQTYPVAFTGIPAVTSSVSLGTSAFVIVTQLTGSTTTNSTIRLVAASSMAQNNGYIVSVYAVGRWK